MQLNTANTIVDNQSLAAKKSYQNCTESDLVGYNDCPTFLFSNKNENNDRNSVSSKKKKALRNTVSSSRTVPISSSFDILNLPDSSATKSITTVMPSPDCNQDHSEQEETLTTEEILLLLTDKINSNLKNLSDKEFSFYKTKFLNHLENLSNNERYLRNLSDIFLMNSDPKSTKILVQNWVSKEPSVSAWLIPLSKII